MNLSPESSRPEKSSMMALNITGLSVLSILSPFF
jgi:hypothetical protein